MADNKEEAYGLTSQEPQKEAVEVSPVKIPSAAARSKKKAQSAFRTISEVAGELNIQQHVLRFWETKFSQIRPLKRGGGRRYYRPEDIQLLKSIQHLLYTEGYTIKGVQKLLKSEGKKKVAQVLPSAQNSNEQIIDPTDPAAAVVKAAADSAILARASGFSKAQNEALSSMLDELKSLRSLMTTE